MLTHDELVKKMLEDPAVKAKYDALAKDCALTTATLDDLYREQGKAELIAGRIVRFPPDGHRPSRIAARNFRSLDAYSPHDRIGDGEKRAD